MNLWNYPRKVQVTKEEFNTEPQKLFGQWTEVNPLTPMEEALMTRTLRELDAKKIPEPAGVKHDTGKPMLDLIDPLAIEGLAAVLTFGANKYAAHNWRGGFKYSRLIAALLRHLFAIMRGEDKDPESGLPHIDHVGCCWMFLSNMSKTRPDLDDRHKA